jgi:hypothetical protein
LDRTKGFQFAHVIRAGRVGYHDVVSRLNSLYATA